LKKPPWFCHFWLGLAYKRLFLSIPKGKIWKKNYKENHKEKKKKENTKNQ
jgi:hypothetical protein